MPPKSGSGTRRASTRGKKAGKGKSSSLVDGLSTEEMSKEQLEEHILRLREELDREREERSFFQLERDKIQAFWEISKRKLEETEAELRNRGREREEAEERHRVEISVYKQKLKHVLAEQHAAVSQLKTDGVVWSSLIQKQNGESELELREETRGLQEALRETQLHNHDSIKELKLRHQVELMELSGRFDRRVREMEMKFHRRAMKMREAEKRKTDAELGELEARMRRRMDALTVDHQKAFRSAEEYYSAAQNKLLADQKLLKEELVEVKNQCSLSDRCLSDARQENQRLQASLQEAEQKLPELLRRQEEQREAKAQREASAARAKALERQLRDQETERELLLQAFQKVEKERDELLRRQMEAIQDVRQRSAMKEMLLERKMAALTEALERKDSQLCAALATADLQRDAGMRLEGILEEKQRRVTALQDLLARDCEDFQKLQQSFSPLGGDTLTPAAPPASA